MGRSLCFILYCLLLACGAVIPASESTSEPSTFFEKRIRPILEDRCFNCHSADAKDVKGGLMLDSKPGMLQGGESGEAVLVPFAPEKSLLIKAIRHDGDLRMPPPGKGEKLTSAQVDDFVSWIKMGAPDPRIEPKSRRSSPDLLRHWAFAPIVNPSIPVVQNKGVARTAIDHFVVRKLEEHGLEPSSPADKRTLLRRITFDVTGLPPTPEEMDSFLRDHSPQAYEKVVDRLLASPRFGERWARHWLDVVRFAETTGFEVNTPRPNAWPYRDYVIRSFNDDKPYNQFIIEQIAGDAFGVGEATGFLVGGANDQVKSPDVMLTRQQRSDELHDMVATTGSVFLGMTVGCARCHNHKFDPISQTDYFAMTAVFSGVQHGERQVLGAGHEKRLVEADRLRKDIAAIEQRMSQFEPTAMPQYASTRKVDSRFNEEVFSPVEAKFVRFTVHRTERHSTIGAVEPCLDELEIYRVADSGNNLALSANGGIVTASGSYTGDPQHQLKHLNDGQYGNEHSWISKERGRGWVQVELPQTTLINRIVWSRDRTGRHRDRVPSAYTIEVGRTVSNGAIQWHRVAGDAPLRSAVHPRHNVDRFNPVRARFVRFTINETNGLEPCIDELEIYTAETEPRNAALASAKARATASSVYPNSAIHRIEHLNDGVYGNSHSWISQEVGKGWVQIEFPESLLIDRIVWGRDREGKFTDRLPTSYKIEVAEDTNSWAIVADSSDRQDYLPGQSKNGWVTSNAADAHAHAEYVEWQQELQRLEARVTDLTSVPMVYAGTFTSPEPIFRLHRGEVMQPREEVSPGALSSLGEPLALPSNATEQERRVALARWIADDRNPLTARVIVNRIWQYHFGEGLVNTPSDFGLNGGKPSHPELLDWMATKLVENGWRMKALHRLILLSSTYRQTSVSREDGAAKDAGNRLLWRFAPRRLEAESIRDTILFVSGKLDLQMGGPGYQVFEPNDNYVRVYEPKKEFGPAEWRRMIYQFKPRMQQDATFGAFDCPDGGQIAPRRGSSTTPLQALNLLNSSFVIQQADFTAERLQSDAPSIRRQVMRAFSLAFNRPPTRDELSAAEKFVKEQGLVLFCRTLFNANEFVYLF